MVIKYNDEKITQVFDEKITQVFLDSHPPPKELASIWQISFHMLSLGIYSLCGSSRWFSH